MNSLLSRDKHQRQDFSHWRVRTNYMWGHPVLFRLHALSQHRPGKLRLILANCDACCLISVAAGERADDIWWTSRRPSQSY